MPHVIWNYNCCVLRHHPIDLGQCPMCGGPAELGGCALTEEEELEQYERAFGLRASGPHRELADELLSPLREPCTRCDGVGFVVDAVFSVEHDWWEKADVVPCPECEGAGGVWRAPEHALVAAHRAVTRRHPDAVLPGPSLGDDVLGILSMEG